MTEKKGSQESRVQGFQYQKFCLALHLNPRSLESLTPLTLDPQDSII